MSRHLVTPLRGLLLATLGCGGGTETAAKPPARSAVASTAAHPGLPKERPTPFQVELRRKEGAHSQLLRIADSGMRFNVGRDQHDVTVFGKVDAETLDALWATLREHSIQDIISHGNPDAATDGTSIRLLAGRRRINATRMGHFEPMPRFVEDYNACLAALEGLIPGVGATQEGVSLVIAFDESMAQRRASVELELDDVIAVDTADDLTLRVRTARPIEVRLRFGPPATEIRETVELARTGKVVIAVDAELGQPSIQRVPRATESQG